jgi:hypothetical protein
MNRKRFSVLLLVLTAMSLFDVCVFSVQSSPYAYSEPTDYHSIKTGDSYLVRDVNYDGFYYANGGPGWERLATANEFTLLAHWKIQPSGTDIDPYLYTFVPELPEIYGQRPNTQLLGAYHFKILSEDGLTTRVAAFPAGQSATNPTDTFDIIDIKYQSPYYDIPYYVLPTQLVTLQTPFADRNLTDSISGVGDSPVDDHSYTVCIDRIGFDINVATFLTVYKTTEVALGETGHSIPYFAFSLTKNGEEYFLNVVEKQPQDSVYWTRISAEEKDIIVNPEKYRDPAYQYQFKKYKFCFPYQVDANGQRVTPVKFGEPGYEIEYQPVYLQTLSANDPTDYPYVVLVGQTVKYAVAQRLDELLDDPSGTNSLKWNIYSMNYSRMDSRLVTSWIFAGKHSDENEWAPLGDPVNGTYSDVEGLLTDVEFSGGGVLFIGESKDSPIHYSVLTDIENASLEILYAGREMIGSYVKHPIFYYKIKIAGKDLYLTDSRYETDPGYKYTWVDGRRYPRAYFREEKFPDYEGYFPTKADEKFIQTFGFRYIDPNDSQNPFKETNEFTFVIVSNANFKNYGSDNYQYLTDINGRLIFVDYAANALVFKFGRKNEGGFVGLEIVGKGDIFGVVGGVRLLNQSGKVDIYTIDGRLIKSVAVTAADQTIAVPAGLVIVKTAGRVAKVIVK